MTGGKEQLRSNFLHGDFLMDKLICTSLVCVELF